MQQRLTIKPQVGARARGLWGGTSVPPLQELQDAIHSVSQASAGPLQPDGADFVRRLRGPCRPDDADAKARSKAPLGRLRHPPAQRR